MVKYSNPQIGKKTFDIDQTYTKQNSSPVRKCKKIKVPIHIYQAQ